MASSIKLLTSLEDHRMFLKHALEECSEDPENEDKDVKDMLIISPYVRLEAMEMDGMRQMFANCNENVKVYVSDSDTACLLACTSGRNFLLKNRIDFDIVHNLHTKCLILGEDVIAIGSFNWLSSVRVEKYSHHDVTTVITGTEALPLIEQIYAQILTFKIKNPIHEYLVERIANKTHTQYISIFVELIRKHKGPLRTEDVYSVFNEIPSDKTAR